MTYSEEELSTKIAEARASGIREGIQAVARIALEHGVNIDNLCNTALDSVEDTAPASVKDIASSSDSNAQLLELVNNLEGEFSRDLAVEILQNLKGVKITHILFGSDEYLYKDGVVLDESGYVFEDWTTARHNGMRMRKGGIWEGHWRLYRG